MIHDSDDQVAATVPFTAWFTCCSTGSKNLIMQLVAIDLHTPQMPTMSSTMTMAKTLHPACALVGYTIITTLVFGGMFSSAFNMFVVFFAPTCVDGTTSTPYSFQLSDAGIPTPSTGPNAPNPDAVPFCSSDALYASVLTEFLSYGYLGLEYAITDFFSASQYSTQTFPFCFKLTNGTCPTQDDVGANFQTCRATTDNAFTITDRSQFRVAIATSYFFSGFHNFPVTFGPSGTALPGGIDGSKTYYLRNVTRSKFRVAADTTGLPLQFTSYPSNDIKVTFPTLASCPAEQNVLASQNRINPSNVKSDGTLKTDTGTCGYCVTQQQQTGNRAVLGICGITITLLLVMDLMMCIPAIRKKAFFRNLVIALSVLCIIFLIAAVSSAAGTFMSVAQCFSLSDFSQSQYMPSPTAQKINGYTPSSGGASYFYESKGMGLFQTTQQSGVASYLKPYVLPSSGAVQLIIAIVLMSIFTVFFAIKVDWAQETKSEGTRLMERVPL